MWLRCCCSDKATDKHDIKSLIANKSLDDAQADPSIMVLVFEKPDGLSKQVTCTQRPLGMKFTKGAPLTVTEVHANGHAHDLGIERGWKLRCICEEDLLGKGSEFVIGTLSQRTHLLPLGAKPSS